MTPLEMIAFIIIVLSAIKISVIIISPRLWFNFAKNIWKNTGIVRISCLILAVIVLYYLILERVTIIHIFAVTAFVALTIAFGLGERVNDLIKHYEKLVKNRKMLKDHWLYILIWVALMIWGIQRAF